MGDGLRGREILSVTYVFFGSNKCKYMEDHQSQLVVSSYNFKPFRPFGRGTTPVSRGHSNHGY